ncbi:MAG TPA: tetratricopeptide repeat protein [Methylomirabilota bacterium]|nr:tetratricopeptide repeat protein [Methylomirabilota bacterium]
MSELAEFLQSRGARFGLKIAGVVVALGLVGVAGWLWLRAEEARGQAALAAAEAVQQGEGPLATAEGRQKAVGMLQAVLTQHGRSAAAAQAAYQLGNLQYQAGDYAAARAAYEVALTKGAGGSLRTLSASGVGYTWEAQKNYANAVTAYEAAARGLGPKQFFFEEALLDLARAQTLAGKPAEARATYERLLKDAPETRRAEDIRGRIAALAPAAK